MKIEFVIFAPLYIVLNQMMLSHIHIHATQNF